MQHRIILPGATTLTRLISEVREKATLRLWNKLALIPSAEQRSQLEMLLGPTDCSRLSLLESLKKGPVTISGPAFNEAIERWKTLNDFGLHAENLSTLPAVRLKNLARCWYDFGVQYCRCHRRKGWRFWLPLSLHGNAGAG
ncbi:hypothetical protein [Klebsiella pneumoniae]|uniref:hypothetical protein n=1 Tax=Klebsiella pneumoniae TaxID=573 RepID=UPI003D18D2F1